MATIKQRVSNPIVWERRRNNTPPRPAKIEEKPLPPSSPHSPTSPSKRMTKARKHLIFMAKLAALAGRDEEVLESMKTIGELGDELSMDEKNLLSVSFKRVVDAKRASWRVMVSIEQKERKERSPNVEKIQHPLYHTSYSFNFWDKNVF